MEELQSICSPFGKPPRSSGVIINYFKCHNLRTVNNNTLYSISSRFFITDYDKLNITFVKQNTTNTFYFKSCETNKGALQICCFNAISICNNYPLSYSIFNIIVSSPIFLYILINNTSYNDNTFINLTNQSTSKLKYTNHNNTNISYHNNTNINLNQHFVINTKSYNYNNTTISLQNNTYITPNKQFTQYIKNSVHNNAIIITHHNNTFITLNEQYTIQPT